MNNILIQIFSQSKGLIAAYSNDFKFVQIFEVEDTKIKQSIFLNFDSDYKDLELYDYDQLLRINFDYVYGKTDINCRFDTYSTKFVNLAKLTNFNNVNVTGTGIFVTYNTIISQNKYELTGRIICKTITEFLKTLQKLIINIKKIDIIGYDKNMVLRTLVNERALIKFSLVTMNLLESVCNFSFSEKEISKDEIDEIVKLLLIYKNNTHNILLRHDIFKFNISRWFNRNYISLELFGNDLGTLATDKPVNYYDTSQIRCFSYLKQNNLLEPLKELLKYHALKNM